MDYLTPELQKHHVPYSWRGIRVRLCFPNIYSASSIDDFEKHKSEVQPTPNKLFVGRKYVEGAVIFFRNCQYRYAETETLSDLPSDLASAFQDASESGLLSRACFSDNALLADLSGELKMRSFLDIPDKTRLQLVTTVYYPNENYHVLDDYRMHGHPTRARGRIDLFDRISELVPQPA